MSWKTKRRTQIDVSGERPLTMVPFGKFAETFRRYLVDLLEELPLLFADGFYFLHREGYEAAPIQDPDMFLALAIKSHEAVQRVGRDSVPYTDAEGNESERLGPEMFTSLTGLRVYLSGQNGSSKVELRYLYPDRGSDCARWTLMLHDFPADLQANDIDSLLERTMLLLPEVRRVRAYKAAPTFTAAVRRAAANIPNSHTVYWKNWYWDQPLAEGSLPDGISQYQSHGGVWTVVNGADEVPADPAHPLVALCVEATRISEPKGC